MFFIDIIWHCHYTNAMSDSELIRKLINDLGITQLKLAEMLGYKNQSTISKILSGKRRFSHIGRVHAIKLLSETQHE